MQFVGSCIFFSSRNSLSANCKLLYSSVKFRYLTFSEPFSRFFSKCLTCFSILLTFAILSFLGGSRGLCATNKIWHFIAKCKQSRFWLRNISWKIGYSTSLSQSESSGANFLCLFFGARIVTYYGKEIYGKAIMHFILLFLTSRISSFSCSCTNPLGFSKDMFRQSSIRSSIRGHPPSSEATDALQRPPSPHGVALVNNARDL